MCFTYPLEKKPLRVNIHTHNKTGHRSEMDDSGVCVRWGGGGQVCVRKHLMSSVDVQHRLQMRERLGNHEVEWAKAHPCGP